MITKECLLRAVYLWIREVLQEEYTASGGDPDEHAATEQNHVGGGGVPEQLQWTVHQRDARPAEKTPQTRSKLNNYMYMSVRGPLILCIGSLILIYPYLGGYFRDILTRKLGQNQYILRQSITGNSCKKKYLNTV